MTDERTSRARIRLVALAVIRDGPRLLVRRYETPDSDRYYRPLGGAVEFGERAAQTAIRELREEIGAEIENVRYLATLENLFERDGQPGHQIVFVFDADFADRSHYAAELRRRADNWDRVQRQTHRSRVDRRLTAARRPAVSRGAAGPADGPIGLLNASGEVREALGLASVKKGPLQLPPAQRRAIEQRIIG